MSELESIFSDSREFKIAKDRTIKIKQITLGDLPVVLNIMTKIFDMYPKMQKADAKTLVMKAVADDFESIKSIFSITTDLKQEEIGRLNLVAATQIIAEVFKDNADFLSQKLVPVIKDLVEKINPQTTAGIGKSKN